MTIESASSSKQPVKIYAGDAGRLAGDVGDVVMVFATIIDDPHADLAGYEAESSGPVLWAGFSKSLGKP